MRKWIGILACFCSVGCGGTPANTSGSASNSSALIPITNEMGESFGGHYLGACHGTYYNGLKLFSISDESYTTNNQTYDLENSFFWDASCQIPFGQGQERGHYLFYTFFSNDGTGSGINFQFPYSFFKPATNQVSNLLDAKHFCDRADWLMDVWTPTILEITNRSEAIATTDSTMKTLVRTECSNAQPTVCLQVTLIRQ